jgi:hypothetical protein
VNVLLSVAPTGAGARLREPLRVGVPFPFGLLRDPGRLALTNDSGEPMPLQSRVLGRWPDGSVKWLLVDTVADLPSGASARFSLIESQLHERGAPPPASLELDAREDALEVNTGTARFVVARDARHALASALCAHAGLLDISGIVVRLVTDGGRQFDARFGRVHVEEYGPLRLTAMADGRFGGGAPSDLPRVRVRTTFFAGSGVVKLEVGLLNPNAAAHRGGLWDLGDPGSMRFRDVALRITPRTAVTELRSTLDTDSPVQVLAGDWTIYQDSSGGERWDSPNHMDANGVLTTSFSGFEVRDSNGDVLSRGNRASPRLQAIIEGGWLAVAVEDFWQNFPKAIRADSRAVEVALFPRETKGPFELQGGERKRHVVWLEFGAAGDEPTLGRRLAPARVRVDPAWIESSKAVPWFTARLEEGSGYESYISNIVEGEESFAAKRDRIDEYGWRHYGDLYADHEAVRHHGAEPFVSHYNNQYDFVYGAGVHWLRTGDCRWHQLFEPAARHTSDIDIYHTCADRPAFNGGLFWHTDHHKPAATCTHRTYSRRNGGWRYGGGPSNEHNYTSGLLLHHFLTGDAESAAAVRELADWVIAMDDGALTPFAAFDADPTGLASRTVDDSYHGPGRGAGNSVNALLDAWQLAGQRHYLDKAEALIRRCIHPADDVAARGLSDPEHRWSYLVFLQVLAKYLRLCESASTAESYAYARESLLTYARWMAVNEQPYMDQLGKVFLPTETWPAHDVRKAHVLGAAATYVRDPVEADAFRRKAAEFQRRAIEGIASFPSAKLTRPLVILAVHGFVHSYFLRHPEHVQSPDDQHDFGRSKPFVPQRQRLIASVRRKVAGRRFGATSPTSHGYRR